LSTFTCDLAETKPAALSVCRVARNPHRSRTIPDYYTRSSHPLSHTIATSPRCVTNATPNSSSPRCLSAVWQRRVRPVPAAGCLESGSEEQMLKEMKKYYSGTLMQHTTWIRTRLQYAAVAAAWAAQIASVRAIFHQRSLPVGSASCAMQLAQDVRSWRLT